MSSKYTDELYSMADAAEALTENAGRFQSSMSSLAKSKHWNVISRMASGILPGFWSMQNKLRAITIMFDIYYKNQD